MDAYSSLSEYNSNRKFHKSTCELNEAYTEAFWMPPPILK